VVIYEIQVTIQVLGQQRQQSRVGDSFRRIKNRKENWLHPNKG